MSEEERFKVVVVPGGGTAYIGSDKDKTGIPRDQADADCAKRNARAEELGIKSRYAVEPV